MNLGRTVFAQLLDHLPSHSFRRCVARYSGNRKVHRFSCWDQFVAMAFAQLTFRESLRDIESCLRVHTDKLYHIGMRSVVARNTLANANTVRDWRIYADFAQHLIVIARTLYVDEPFRLELDNTVYALDSTTIDLCLALFPWAHFRRHKAAVKLHTLMDLRGNIPSVIRITHGKVHDNMLLDEVAFEPGAFYIMDRAYGDFARLHRLMQSGAFFVTRARAVLDFRRVESRPVDPSTGPRCDQTIALCGPHTRHRYPSYLRRIRYIDPVMGKRLTFLTNNFILDALTIAHLYHMRWQIELFFKWIKQHLRIKAFYGTSENAVKTQIWIAVSVYVLVAIIKKRLNLTASLHTILQQIGTGLFEKMPLQSLFEQGPNTNSSEDQSSQLFLFD